MDSGLIDWLKELWPHLTGLLWLTITISASIHVVLYKRDTRSAIGWVGIIWLAPLVGTALYVLLGINRIQRRAVKRRGRKHRAFPEAAFACRGEALAQALADCRGPQFIAQDRLVTTLTGKPLLSGNQVDVLTGGEQAYPAMLSSIDSAQRTVSMGSYIFDNDRAGNLFADALARAHNRGVQVRVLIDDIGARYTWPPIDGVLKAAGVPVARFLPTMRPGFFAYANMRSHRKLLVVDGQVGYTGGLNIREGHDAGLHPTYRILDTHFCLRGPAVVQLQEVFADDWEFSTGESLQGDAWFPKIEPAGQVLARGIATGPDGDADKLRLTLLGALACAESSIVIITPYFLPEEALIKAMDVAALRGVQVDVILPSANNLTLVQWASTATYWQVLKRGCRIWLTPPPFDHTKLMVVDGVWTLLGSSNWDPRSLRLNFEFDVECYDRELAQAVTKIATGKRQNAKLVTLADVDGRPLPIRLRDGIARLFTPYL